MSITAEKSTSTFSLILKEKLADYASLVKMRLTILVVFSAILGYLIGVDSVVWVELLSLSLGGFLVTASSNGANEIIERSYDRLMDRTKSRPLATERMSLIEAYSFVILSGLGGITILWLMLNPLCGILGMLALFTYVFVYTPLKRITPISVLVGAFPGAIPPMLGWVAANGYFDLEAGILFAIQFIWQFPHFWAIAWVADKDYRKAGFRMLPSKKGKDKTTAFFILFYTLLLIPVSLLPVMFQFTGWVAGIFLLVLGTSFLIPAISLFRNQSDKFAKQVMFGSFIYLPMMLIVLLIDKL